MHYISSKENENEKYISSVHMTKEGSTRNSSFKSVPGRSIHPIFFIMSQVNNILLYYITSSITISDIFLLLLSLLPLKNCLISLSSASPVSCSPISCNICKKCRLLYCFNFFLDWTSLQFLALLSYSSKLAG